MILHAVLILASACAGGAENVLASATAALERGDARGARELIESILRESDLPSLDASTAARAWLVRGLASEALGDPEAALSSLERALGDAPALPGEEARETALLAMARSALEMKDGAAAEKALERLGPGGLARQPASGLLALSFVLEGDLRRAEPALAAALREGPSAPASFQLGVILFDRGEREAALSRFDEALRLEPEDYYATIYKARAQLELDRPRDAAATLAGFSREKPRPETPEACYLLGKALQREERLEAAVESFAKAVALNPSYAEAHFGLGTVLRRLGRAADSRSALDRFQSLHRLESERLRKADELSQALLRSPRDAGAAQRLAELYLESGDNESAERNAWKSLRIEPGRVGARITLASALARSGRFTAAAGHYQRVLQADPSNRDARAALSELIEKHAKREK